MSFNSSVGLPLNDNMTLDKYQLGNNSELENGSAFANRFQQGDSIQNSKINRISSLSNSAPKSKSNNKDITSQTPSRLKGVKRNGEYNNNATKNLISSKKHKEDVGVVDDDGKHESMPVSDPKIPSSKSRENGQAFASSNSTLPASTENEGEDDTDDVPLNVRIKQIKEERKRLKSCVKVKQEDVKMEKVDPAKWEEEHSDSKSKAKKTPVKKEVASKKSNVKEEKTQETKPDVKKSEKESKRQKKKLDEEEEEVWKWWEEDKGDDNTQKWETLEHNGILFAPEYEPFPSNISFKYNGHDMQLSPPTEEIATFYAKMLEHDYTKNEIFNKNFMQDWRQNMTNEEREKIQNLELCDFTQIHAYFVERSEIRKARSKEVKKKEKEEAEEIRKKYGFCILDGRKQKIGNFRVEPPGLFRGRGDHPKMGRVKNRILPRDIIMNCSKGKAPPPPAGHKWKSVIENKNVAWLACWTENIQNGVKYVMLNPSSKLKAEKDWLKYETARRLKTCVEKIRKQYHEDWRNKKMAVRQRAVALYFIDKLALRAGNEKEEGESADTVGCCSLRVEHIKLHEKDGDDNFVVEFDFLGKDSIRYHNKVPVEKRVFKNLIIFKENKKPSDNLFDRLTTTAMNKHLNELMEGLTAKVFRTFNASQTLQMQLEKRTPAPQDTKQDVVSEAEKLLAYNRANRDVAILCNHQRSIPKSHDKSMQNIKNKIEEKKHILDKAKKELKKMKSSKEDGKSTSLYEKKKQQLKKIMEQLQKLEVQATDRDENKTIALGTSKLNYLDPRISVAWAKRNNVAIEKVYNATQRAKFRWAIEMATADFIF